MLIAEEQKRFSQRMEPITKLVDKKCGFQTQDFVNYLLFLQELKMIKTLLAFIVANDPSEWNNIWETKNINLGIHASSTRQVIFTVTR